MKGLWFLRLLFYIPFYVFCLLAAPFVVVFATPQDGATDNGTSHAVEPRLPHWLNWLQTPDNSLWGDSGWRTEHCRYWQSYFGMVCWLWRNPAYGLAWGPFAYVPQPGTTYSTAGDPTIHARDDARAGWYRITSSDGAWERTSITRLGPFTKCLKLRTGWILGDAQPGRPCLYLFSLRIMPFRPGAGRG